MSETVWLLAIIAAPFVGVLLLWIYLRSPR